jgi:RNA polymerase sigma factor for flagellar operon FliA
MESTNQEKALWQSYGRDHSPMIQEEIINMYIDRTKAVAASLYLKRPNNAVDFSDYYHYAIVGLLEAMRTYKVEKNDNFFAYARVRIKGSVLDGISIMTEKALQIKQNNTHQQRLSSLKDEKFNKHDLFGDFLNLSVSLAIGFIIEAVETSDSGYYSTSDQSELREILDYCVRNIDPDQRNVIIYHYYYEVEFKTIAEIMNLSRSRVAQLHKSGIESVREIYEKAVNLDVAY